MNSKTRSKSRKCAAPKAAPAPAVVPAPAGPYTREGLLTHYGLSDRTLRRLTEELQLVRLEPVAAHGRVRYAVDARADLMLRLGRFCPYSFPGQRPPFLRYVLFGLLTGPPADTVAGLAIRGVLHRTIDLRWIEGVAAQLAALLPSAVRPFVTGHAEPTTDMQRTLHAALLDIAGVRLAYERPDMLDAFFWRQTETMHFAHQVLLTHSASLAQKADLINAAAETQVADGETLLLWEAYFFDRDFMSPADFDWYLGTIPPEYRRAYRESARMSLREWAVATNQERDATREMEVLGSLVRRRAMEDVRSADTDRFTAGMRALAVAMRLGDLAVKKAPHGSRAAPGFLAELPVGEYDFDSRYGETPENDRLAAAGGAG